MLKRRITSPTNAGSVGDGIDVSKGGDTSHKSTWAPMVVFLGPCYAVKKVQFGRPVEHIDFRDTTQLYETLPLETAVLAWTGAAHEGTMRGLKQHMVLGVSMMDRLFSKACAEMRLCALYFGQQITRREFKEGMRALITDDFVFNSFQIAVRRMRNDKKITKMSTTLQIYLSEAYNEVRSETLTRLKWAIKYNPEVICVDEGNLKLDSYDIAEALCFACKYRRKVRIARWGEEIPDVPLCELLYLSLVDFLHTGRYVDCEYVARSHAHAEARHRNGLGLVTTAEDFAFDHGYVLDKDGFVTKFRKPSSPTVRKFPFTVPGLFRPNPKRSSSESAPGSPAPSTSRKGSFLSLGLSTKSASNELCEEYKVIERRIQAELGIAPAEVDAGTELKGFGESEAVLNGEGRETRIDEDGGGSDDEAWAETAAAAARNAHRVRTETNWVTFLNHKTPSSGSLYPGRSSSRGRGQEKCRASSRRGSFRSIGGPEGEPPASPRSVLLSTSPAHELQAELGSYSYGLGDKKPYKPAQSGAADRSEATTSRGVWKEPSVTHFAHIPHTASSTTAENVPCAKLSEANLVRNHSLCMVELEIAEQEKLQMQLQAQEQQQAPTHWVRPNASKAVEKSRSEVVVNASLTDANPPRAASIVQKNTGNSPASALIAKNSIAEASPQPLPLLPQAALTIKIPSDVSLLSTADSSGPTLDPAVDVSERSVPVSVPGTKTTVVVSSPRFAPRARLEESPASSACPSPTQDKTCEVTKSAVKETDALKGETAFKILRPHKLSSPTSTSVTTPGTAPASTSTSTSMSSSTSSDVVRARVPLAVPAPVIPPRLPPAPLPAQSGRIATPTAVRVTRPAPRAPSAMNLPAPPLPTTVSAPASVPAAQAAVTVREKTDVIEGRLQAQQKAEPVQVRFNPKVVNNLNHASQSQNEHQMVVSAPDPKTEMNEPEPKIVTSTSDLQRNEADPKINTLSEATINIPSPEPKKAPVLTQKKLQQKWAFNTVMRNQAAHNK